MNNELEVFDDVLDQEPTTVSMETHIPESNIGYRLLQKMGWQRGKGLGTEGQGRIDPIRIELKDDSLGVGKAEEYLNNHISSTSKRKATEFEKQLDETELQKLEREHHVEKKQAIAKEISQVIRAFYCELCDKQYKKVSEYEQHLQSYDHHHKKRFRDMKEKTKTSSSEREKKLARERKREEKEMKRMQEALQKKMGQAVPPVSSSPTIATSTITSASDNSNGGGGWSQVETTSNNGSGSGGWSQVDVSSNNSSGGGWSQVDDGNSKKSSGDWSQVDNTSKGDVSQTTSSNTASVNRVEPTPNTPKTSHNEPKKLSFGLKKTSFQFGLKKK